MKLHLIIAGLGGSQPVIQITGSQAGIFNFIWDRPRGAHVLTYDFSKPGVEKKFRQEQFDLLNQPHQWPITLDVTLDEKDSGSRIQDSGKASTPETKAPEAPKPSEKLQDGEVASRLPHKEKIEGSSPSPATTEEKAETLKSETLKAAPAKPAPKTKAKPRGKAKG